MDSLSQSRPTTAVHVYLCVFMCVEVPNKDKNGFLSLGEMLLSPLRERKLTYPQPTHA